MSGWLIGSGIVILALASAYVLAYVVVVAMDCLGLVYGKPHRP